MITWELHDPGWKHIMVSVFGEPSPLTKPPLQASLSKVCERSVKKLPNAFFEKGHRLMAKDFKKDSKSSQQQGNHNI